MEFALTDTQRAMQDSLDRMLSAEGSAGGSNAWKVAVATGLPGLLVPEEHGGLGLGVMDAVLAAETLGRHVSPLPFIGTAVLAPLTLLGAASGVQRARWLPAIAAGEAVVGVGVSGAAAGIREDFSVSVSGGKLSGEAVFVLDTAGAAAFILADDSGGLYLVEAGAPGLDAVPLRTIDETRAVATLRLDRVPAEPLSSSDGPAALRRAIDAARVAIAADTLGAASLMLERAVAYAKERRQFGRPIGSFQAVKHLCAGMAAELEPGRSLVWHAGHAQDVLPDAARLAAHAKSYMAEAGQMIARTAIEVHGGIGFTEELGLHRWFKRIGLNRQLLGGPSRLRAEAAALRPIQPPVSEHAP
ncbi:acyl-CoA dehydrogenase family protein [Roseomonas chloroacetimidivorans]|uniref:acyl-CoA dehydrogenase family protein n=1 Tax=Roseomonas chloroacetimidivorans TaxID=1766656 RepID=UPI003C727BE7